MPKANWIIHIVTKVVATTNMPTVILKNNLNIRHLTFVEKARSHFHTVVWIIHLDQNDTLPSQAIQSKYSFDFFPHRINLIKLLDQKDKGRHSLNTIHRKSNKVRQLV